MKIRNQSWMVTDKHLVITLHQPYWSAYKLYGWESRFGIKCEGLGVSVEAVDKAIELKLKIRVNVIKYGSYEITPTEAKRWGEQFLPRDNKPILVIPRMKFTRIPRKGEENGPRTETVSVREALVKNALSPIKKPTQESFL